MNSVTDDLLAGGIDKALSRSRIYALLAMGFGYPDEDAYLGFSEGGSFADEIRQELGVCAPELQRQFSEVTASQLKLNCTREEFQSQFLSAFETNMPTPSAALNEGAHIFKNDRPGLLLELKGFYRTFGLRVDGMGNELEDTLTAELEFMQFVALKQAQAQVQGSLANGYMAAQKDFLERHLCAWLPSLRAEISEKVRTPFYVALALFAEAFVLAHLSELKRELDR